MPEQNTQNGMELYKSNGLLVCETKEKISSKGVKLESVTTSIGKPKEVAKAFNIKGEAVTLKREEAGRALLTGIVMEIGGLAQNPSAIGSKVKRSTLANGNVQHTFIVTENKASSASEAAIAAYLGKTVAEVRAMRKAAIDKPAIDVQGTVQPNANAPTSIANQVPIAQKPPTPELTGVGV